MPQTSASAASDISSLDAVLDALPISMYLVDRDLTVVAWNKARETGPLGVPRKQALGRPLKDVLSSKGFEVTVPLLQQVFVTGQPQEETTEARGQARQFRIRRLPVRQGRKVTHVLSWFEDITAQRALEMQLIASDRLAFLGQLVAGVAHEVSNPLASIAGCAEALASLAVEAPAKRAKEEAREFRELIRGEVARCERIVRSLLHSARPDPASSADIKATVETALRLLERHPAFTRVRVVQRIPEGLPEARIEPDSLKQVVIALAANAARVMPGGGTLTFRAGRQGADLVLDVLDTGPGVAPALRSCIFEPFFTTDSSKGTGLGLAIARSLVRSRGGDLTYRPRPRSGAAFRVQLVLAQRGLKGARERT